MGIKLKFTSKAFPNIIALQKDIHSERENFTIPFYDQNFVDFPQHFNAPMSARNASVVFIQQINVVSCGFPNIGMNLEF